MNKTLKQSSRNCILDPAVSEMSWEIHKENIQTLEDRKNKYMCNGASGHKSFIMNLQWSFDSYAAYIISL